MKTEEHEQPHNMILAPSLNLNAGLPSAFGFRTTSLSYRQDLGRKQKDFACYIMPDYEYKIITNTCRRRNRPQIPYP
jgi:hypothetical protein